MKFFLLSVFVCASLIEITITQDVSFDLDGGTLYEIAWLSRDDQDQAGAAPAQLNSPPLRDLLPNTLQDEGQWTEESVLMKSGDNEHYICLLPGSVSSDNEDKVDEESSELSPEYLLRPIHHQCTRLLMGYWNYELCHGDYLRQYHEEKLENGQVEVDEYLLGEYSDDLTDTPTPEPPVQEGKKIPVWPVLGREYPYYSVKLGGGTPCDLKNMQPRSVVIRYICDNEAYKYGTLLRVDEATTCKYEALVSTPQLCQNAHYRLRENPIQPIKCFPRDGSPRRPNALLEQEILSASFKASSQKATPTDTAGSEELTGSRVTEMEKSHRRGATSQSLDKGFIKSFLIGELCLRGGAGWWLHEVCYGSHVKQLHIGQSGEREEVVLGYWDDQAHREWFKKTGFKKMSDKSVSHLYKGGDVCDITGTPRQCQVKYKCIKTSKSSQISLYLEEPTTCSYTLTVEGAFVCQLFNHRDDNGVFDLASFETEKNESEDQEAAKDNLKTEALEAVKGEGNAAQEASNEGSKEKDKTGQEAAKKDMDVEEAPKDDSEEGQTRTEQRDL